MKIVFMGTPDFAVTALDAILAAGHDVVGVVTVPDRQTGRGLKVTFSPVKQYALDHSLHLLQPEKLRDPEFQEQLRALKADIFVVVAFRMLPQSVWAMPPLGTFNLHASLLPQYRGAAPINWAIINGEKETGVTTFMLNEHIDEGSILLQERTPITPEDTAETLHDRLAEIGSKLIVKTLQGLIDGTLSPQPQPACNNLRPAPKIFKPDCAIDWNKPGRSIVDFVRGLSPYPAATMQLQDTKGASLSFKVYEVAFEPAENTTVGALISDGKNMQKIGIQDGYIHILSLQLSGKKRISIQEFLRGYDTTNWKLVP
ncbi:MAG: methionyl-tRNA formyltransferase [Bacteroidales bacterium]|nr:methionyl-tRNA formyltransferase [Bacteroidales bacterium]